jgi:hypothetical protein
MNKHSVTGIVDPAIHTLPISVVIINHNQAKALDRSLSSTRWAAERLVLDCGSTDNSLAVIRQEHATVFRHWGENPLLQLENALKAAKNNWILWLQPGEMVSDDLLGEIEVILEKSSGSETVAGYRLRRLQTFQGTPLNLAPASANPPLRLIRQGAWHVEAGWYPSIGLIQGQAATLHRPLLIKPIETVAELLDEINRYSSFIAYEQISLTDRTAVLIGKIKAGCSVLLLLLTYLFQWNRPSKNIFSCLVERLIPFLIQSKIQQLNKQPHH